MEAIKMTEVIGEGKIKKSYFLKKLNMCFNYDILKVNLERYIRANTGLMKVKYKKLP